MITARCVFMGQELIVCIKRDDTALSTQMRSINKMDSGELQQLASSAHNFALKLSDGSIAILPSGCINIHFVSSHCERVCLALSPNCVGEDIHVKVCISALSDVTPTLMGSSYMKLLELLKGFKG